MGIDGNVKHMRDVCDAVGDPTGRRLLALLAQAGEMPLHELVDSLPMGRTAVSKHLTILREAGLVEARKAGREIRFRLHAAPLREIQGWNSYHVRFWTQRIDRLKELLKEETS